MTTTVTAPDIECDGCAQSIRNALARVPGVSGIDVNVASKQVTVEHGNLLTREVISEALDKAGFPVKG